MSEPFSYLEVALEGHTEEIVADVVGTVIDHITEQWSAGCGDTALGEDAVRDDHGRLEDV